MRLGDNRTFLSSSVLAVLHVGGIGLSLGSLSVLIFFIFFALQFCGVFFTGLISAFYTSLVKIRMEDPISGCLSI